MKHSANPLISQHTTSQKPSTAKTSGLRIPAPAALMGFGLVASAISGVTTALNAPTPTAVDDIFTVQHNTPLTGSFTTNDTAPCDAQTFTTVIEIDSGPSNGTLTSPNSQTFSATSCTNTSVFGKFTYTPSTGFTGSDSVMYRLKSASDPNVFSTATATFNVQASPVVPTPVATDDNFTVQPNTPFTGNMTANDTVPCNTDSQTFTTIQLVTNPTKGSFTSPNSQVFSSATLCTDANAFGQFTYTPSPSFSGTDTVQYKLTTGAKTSTATITFSEPCVSGSGNIADCGTVGNTGNSATVTDSQNQTVTLALADPSSKAKIGYIRRVTNAGSPPSGLVFKHGIFDYLITGLPQTGGASVMVNLTLPAGSTPDSLFKCNNGSCNPLVLGSNASVNGNVITVTLTDGGPLDADGNASNGEIRDPIAPGFVATSSSTGGGFPPTQGGSTTGSGGISDSSGSLGGTTAGTTTSGTSSGGTTTTSGSSGGCTIGTSSASSNNGLQWVSLLALLGLFVRRIKANR